MTDPLDEPDEGTPLTGEERQGLRLPVLTRKELNSAEAENISRAMVWLFLSRRRLRPESVVREAWLQRLHRRMYDQVWAWAGQYRTTDRNLGWPYWQIRTGMRDLEADVQAWLADTSATRFSDDECAIRFGYPTGHNPPVPQRERTMVTASNRRTHRGARKQAVQLGRSFTHRGRPAAPPLHCSTSNSRYVQRLRTSHRIRTQLAASGVSGRSRG